MSVATTQDKPTSAVSGGNVGVSQCREASPRQHQARRCRLLRLLSWVNLLVVAALWFLLAVVSERWWFSSALTYVPRRPYALPALVLLLVGLVCRDRRVVGLNLLAAALVLGPVAGLRAPVWRLVRPPAVPPQALRLRVVTCNVQGFCPDFATVLQELGAVNPDVVALQECRSDNPLLEKFFDGWHQLRVGELWVGSRFPFVELARCRPQAFGRRTALAVLLQTPRGPLLLVNLHLETPRHALLKLTPRTVWDGTGVAAVEKMLERRLAETGETWRFVDRLRGDRPVLVCGDFNMPSTSSLFRDYWSEYRDTFDESGWGYGFTAPCSKHRRWPDHTPWLRIDHILVSSEWQVLWCRVGRTNGSDHRLVAAEVALPPQPRGQ